MKNFFRFTLLFVLFFYFLNLPYITLRNGSFFPAIVNTAFSAAFIYLGFFEEKYLDWFRKSAYICAAVFPWIICFVLDQRIKAGITILFFLFIAAAGIWEFFFKRSEFSYLLLSCCDFLLLMLQFTRDINYYPGDAEMSLCGSLLFGIVCPFVFLFLYKKQIIFLPGKKLGETLFVIVILSAAAAYCVLDTANYAFDISEGSSQELKVNDVYSERLKRTQTYYVKVDYNGEETSFEINVSKYNSIRVGSTVTVTQYDGFLGDEYIIVNEK